MHARLADVDLPELRHFLPERPEFQAREKNKKALVLDFLFERDPLCRVKGTLPRSALRLQRILA